ncbi:MULTISPECIES: copper resistance D family protein [Shewanella]|uniref:Copper resistance protein D n=1 Tax=Shewanella insulae TaxID=2681496 RepID=A0A6L7HX26_9GAMM|nr:CopD family protein [Shewanella insulae]MXR67698.1 copper resistance protein CopD [Shewanella insulae]
MILTSFEIMALLSKWFIYLNVAAIMGGAFMLGSVRLERREVSIICDYVSLGAILGIFAVTVNYLVQVGSFADDGFAGMLDIQMYVFLWATPVGESVGWRLMGFALALSASRLMLNPAQGVRRAALISLVVSTVLLAATFGLAGHSVELHVLARFFIFVHLLAVGCWVGAFYPLWRMCSTLDAIALKHVMDRFGLLGIALVSLVLFSGTGLLWMLFNKPEEFLNSDYGIAVSLKLFLVTIILLFAALHKFILVPKLAHEEQQEMKYKLKNSIALEFIVGLLILATTAVLSSVLGPESLS